MQRSDVVLADLEDFLSSQASSVRNNSNIKIVLAVASDTSSLLPCCGQSLGFKNAQISKLWSAAHWKNDNCRNYWKDIHLICVRKYRPNSTYASIEEVKDVTGDSYAFLHELPPATSPLRKIPSKAVLGARSPSSATANTAAPRRLRSVSSLNKISSASSPSPADHASPSEKAVPSRAPTKPRASEPLIAVRVPSVRSPIVTRRRSNTALQSRKLSVSPQPPLPTSRANASRSPRALSPSVAGRPLTRKVSDSSLAIKPRGRVSAGAPRSVSGSAIPTPVRRASINLLGSIAQDSPGSPTVLRASVRQRKVAPSTVSIGTQTELEPDPLILELADLESQYERLQQEHETTLAYTRELGIENQRLRKQKNSIAHENEKFKDENRKMKDSIDDLKKANQELSDENGWIVVCKTEQEQKRKQLQEENEKLMAQFLILSNQRKEVEGLALVTREQLNDALDEISRLQVEAAAATLSAPAQYPSTPMKTPVTRFKEALDPVTVYKTPFLTPVKQTRQEPSSNPGTASVAVTPVRTGTPQIGSMSARKIRTPLTASAKRGKHGLRFWKRMAKRRMFA